MHDESIYDGPVVYTIQAAYGGPVKIGYCEKRSGVVKRLLGIQTGHPHKLVVRHIAPAPRGRTDESELHDRLAKFRLEGEWFMNVPEVAMATRAKLPKSSDEERRLRPLVESVFAAGVCEGRRQAEVENREELARFFAMASRYFVEDDFPAAEVHSVQFASTELRKWLGKPHTQPHTSHEEVA